MMELYKDNNFKLSIDDDVIHLYFSAEHIDLEIIEKVTEVRIEKISNVYQKKFSLLADCRNILTISREARTRLNSADSETGLIAVAMIIRSRVQKVIFRFLHKPHYSFPSRIFTSQTNALKWLQHFSEKNKESL
jgi:hypothetical protein